MLNQKKNMTDLNKKKVVLELELNGKISFDGLLNIIYHDFGIPYKIITADIDFVGGVSYGTVQLLIEAIDDHRENLEYYLNRNKIMHIAVEKINRKAV